jgi:malonyl-CoA O-methyltransferase
MTWRAGADLYADWAPHYAAEAHNPLMAVEQQAVLQLVPPLQGLRVLDAGCGTGRYARLLAGRGPRTIVAIDRSEAMLAHAFDCDAAYVRGDIRALPLADASVDLIVAGLMLPDVDDLGLLVHEWARVLVPGGTVVSSTLHSVGAELGWTRTFDTPHGTGALPAHWHTADACRTACAAAGLMTDAILEPTLRPDQLSGHRVVSPRVPVAMVFRARRLRQP